MGLRAVEGATYGQEQPGWQVWPRGSVVASPLECLRQGAGLVSHPVQSQAYQVPGGWLWSLGRRLLARSGSEDTIPLQLLPKDPLGAGGGSAPP